MAGAPVVGERGNGIGKGDENIQIRKEAAKTAPQKRFSAGFPSKNRFANGGAEKNLGQRIHFIHASCRPIDCCLVL
jgi:hypothetical protein